MKILIDKSFEKDVRKINDKKVLNSLANCLEDIQEISRLTDIPNCKKLKGSRNAYRIKLGNYRAGFLFINRKLEFIRFLGRKDIYKYFPK